MSRSQNRSPWWTVLVLSLVALLGFGIFSQDCRDVLLRSAASIWVLFFSASYIFEGIITVWNHRSERKTWRDLLSIAVRYFKSQSFIRPTILVYVVFFMVAVINVPIKMAELRTNAENADKLSAATAKENARLKSQGLLSNKVQDEKQQRDRQLAQDQKHFESILIVATNPNPIRAAISSQMPEPIQLPVMSPGRFDLPALREARDNEAKRLKVAQALAAHDQAQAEIINAENAKHRADVAKANSDERLRICNFITGRFTSNLDSLAKEYGDSVLSDYSGILERNTPWQTNVFFTKVQLKANTNWNFLITVIGAAAGAAVADKLLIVCPPNAVQLGVERRRGSHFVRFDTNAIAMEISLGEQASCRLIGDPNKSGNKSGFPIAELQPYVDILTVFIGEVDNRHPLIKSP